jgi:hypothetical protein
MSSPKNWREYPQRYRYEAAKCSKCGKVFFPPRLICDNCRCRQFEKVILPDKGKIITYTIIRIPPPAFNQEAPYAIGIIELENGVRLTAQIVDCDLNKIDRIKEVKIEFRKIQEEGEAGIICYGYKFIPIR